MTDRIILTNLQFEARHGAHAWEREVPQPFEVDVELALDLRPAGEADDLALTIDYGPVARLVGGVLDGPPIQLLEAIADRISGELLAAYPVVGTVVVRVRKPGVQLVVPLDHAAVEITRQRP
jgi:dihydroneopterin aldolase